MLSARTSPAAPARRGEDDAWGGVLGVTKGLYHKFPGRVLDTPISESAFIGAAVGRGGLLGPAPGRRADVRRLHGRLLRPDLQPGGQVPLHVRRQGQDADGRSARCGAPASAPPRQHSQALYPIFTHIPGLKVVVPSTPYDAKGLLIAAIRDDDPVIFFEHKVLYTIEGDVPEEPLRDPVRRGRTSCARATTSRSSRSAAWCSWPSRRPRRWRPTGSSARSSTRARRRPLDEDTILESVENTGRLVVVDEANPRCGMAADIAALVAQNSFDDLKAPVQMVTPPHTPAPFSPALEDAYVPTPATIADAVRGTTGGRSGPGMTAASRTQSTSSACPSGACR